MGHERIRWASFLGLWAGLRGGEVSLKAAAAHTLAQEGSALEEILLHLHSTKLLQTFRHKEAPVAHSFANAGLAEQSSAVAAINLSCTRWRLYKAKALLLSR